MPSKVQKWGNSLAIRLPRLLAEESGLTEGSEVQIATGAKGIVLRPLSRKKASLRELVSRIRSENKHKLLDRGRPAGREVW